MTYRCVPFPEDDRIVLVGPFTRIVHVYDAHYPAHLGTCRRFARKLNEEAHRGELHSR